MGNWIESLGEGVWLDRREDDMIGICDDNGSCSSAFSDIDQLVIAFGLISQGFHG